MRSEPCRGEDGKAVVREGKLAVFDRSVAKAGAVTARRAHHELIEHL